MMVVLIIIICLLYMVVLPTWQRSKVPSHSKVTNLVYHDGHDSDDHADHIALMIVIMIMLQRSKSFQS